MSQGRLYIKTTTLHALQNGNSFPQQDNYQSFNEPF